MIGVADASVVIIFARLDRLGILRDVFGTLVIPEGGRAEVLDAKPDAPENGKVRAAIEDGWLVVNEQIAGAGEEAVIRAADVLDADVVLLDDAQARRQAESAGLRVSGTVGVLLSASRRGLIDDMGAIVTELEVIGFRMSDELRRLLLKPAAP